MINLCKERQRGLPQKPHFSFHFSPLKVVVVLCIYICIACCIAFPQLSPISQFIQPMISISTLLACLTLFYSYRTTICFTTLTIPTRFNGCQLQMSSNDDVEGIRLNKVFKSTHSRREADKLISNGRVTINDEIVESMGQRVIPFQDVVKLDGVVIQGWEARG